MDFYKPKKRRPLSGLSLTIRTVAYVLRHWPIVLIAGLVVAPISPYVRVYYTYIDYGPYKDYNDCLYLGGRGLVERDFGDLCPVIVMIDQRNRGE